MSSIIILDDIKYQNNRKNNNSTIKTNDSIIKKNDSIIKTNNENVSDVNNVEQIIKLPYIDDELGIITLKNNEAIVRLFSKKKLKYNQKIIESTCTYWGMLNVLEKMFEWNKKDNYIEFDKLCILCPIYEYGDTQAGGGGKITNNESYHQACREEIAEEIRLKAGKHFHAGNTCVKISEKKYMVTNIYQFKVDQCRSIIPFDTDNYNQKNRRGIDVYTKRVGYIVWGTYYDCVSVISKIAVSDRNDPLIDGIRGVSIITLKKAISMAKNASNFLRGTIQTSWNAYDT